MTSLILPWQSIINQFQNVIAKHGGHECNGLRLQHFLKEIEGTESFKEIPIISADSDLEEFKATKQKVLNNVMKNLETGTVS